MDDEFGSYDGRCAGCESYGPISDIGLCADCSEKLERDLIRQRDWPYSVTAFALDETRREDLRRRVIAKYGKRHKLIRPSPQAKSKPKRPKRRKRK